MMEVTVLLCQADGSQALASREIPDEYFVVQETQQPLEEE